MVFLTALPAVAATEKPATYGMEIREAWISMPDGVRLSADLYQPTGGQAGEKFPVLLEYLPYRKHEGRSRNWPLYSYFVQRGYVIAAVDIRGTGNSEGRLVPYEYSDIEHADGEIVIDWLSKQPWSNGSVGMFGISWGGFNSIQMAARNIPALKAIVAIDATEDLYQDDVHYMDGIMHLDSWEMSMDLDNARPGAPEYRIDDDNFRNRFDTEPWTLSHKRQQRDGPYWDRASLRDRYDDIRIPTFHIGGWYDGYRDSIARMLEHVKNAPVKAIVGAWHHTWPNEPYPGPGMEWRHEAIRWFDQFLKGEDTGILDEPRFAVFVRDWHPPGPHLEDAPGKWRYEDGWPIARMRERILYPQPNHTLAAETPAATTHQLGYIPSAGFEAGGPVMWWGDVAHDQRGTDAFSLVYDSGPLEADLEILGFPRAILTVAANATRANWIARLSDVAPDGTVTQVTGAAMNGTHRDLGARSTGDRARRAVRARHRDALHVVGVSQGPSHPARGQQCDVADVVADAGTDDDGAEARHITARAARRALRAPPGPGLPPAREGPGLRRGRVDRGRHDLRLRRDLLGRPQSPERHRGREGDQRFRDALPVGHGEIPRDHPLRNQRQGAGRREGHRHAPPGGRAARPHARLGRGVDVSERSGQFLLQLPPAADRKRQAGSREDLEPNHT